MKVKVLLKPDYDTYKILIGNESGEVIADSVFSEIDILNWLEEQGLLKEYVKYMVKNILAKEWIGRWDEIKYSWELEISCEEALSNEDKVD